MHVLDIDNGARFETYVIRRWSRRRDPQRRRRPPRAPRATRSSSSRYAQYDEAELARLRADRRARRRAQPTDDALRPRGRAVTSADRPPWSRSPHACAHLTDLLVLGSGVAGLSAAVRARRAGLSVAVLTKGELGWSATRYAQGGVAAALDEDDDSPELHGSDTLAAGAGLCDADAVRVLVSEGPTACASSWRSARTSTGSTATRRAGPGARRWSLRRARRARGRRRDRRRDRAGARRRGPGVRRRGARAAGSASTSSSRTAASSACRGDRTRRRRGACAARHVVDRDRWRGAVLRGHHQPGAVDRRRDRDGAARRRRGRRPRVHAVPPHRAAPPVDAAAAALRGAARRGRDPARRARRRVHGRRAPAAPTSRPRDVVAGRSAGGSSSATSTTSGSTPPASTTSRPASRRSGGRAATVGLDPTRDWLPVAPAAHYLSGGVVHRPRRRDARCRASGRAARRRAPASTARTGSRRTRCSRGSCSRRARSRRSSRARTAPSRPACCATPLPEPVAVPPRRHDDARSRRSATSCSG